MKIAKHEVNVIVDASMEKMITKKQDGQIEKSDTIEVNGLQNQWEYYNLDKYPLTTQSLQFTDEDMAENLNDDDVATVNRTIV